MTLWDEDGWIVWPDVEPWQRTPRWKFWRPRWRRRRYDRFSTFEFGWEYATDAQMVADQLVNG